MRDEGCEKRDKSRYFWKAVSKVGKKVKSLPVIC